MKKLTSPLFCIILVVAFQFLALVSNGQSIEVNDGGTVILTTGTYPNSFTTTTITNSATGIIQVGNTASIATITGDLSGYYGGITFSDGSLLVFNPSNTVSPLRVLVGGSTSSTNFVKKGAGISITGYDADNNSMKLLVYGKLDLTNAENTGDLTLAKNLMLSDYNQVNTPQVKFAISSSTPNKLICTAGRILTDDPTNGQIDVSKHFAFDMTGATGTAGTEYTFVFAHTQEEPFFTGVPNVVVENDWSLFSVDKVASGGGWDIRLTATYRAPAKVLVETKADGTGVLVAAQNVTAGNSITVYAISRDADDHFVENIAATAWSLENSTDGIVTGDLVANPDSKSAVFTGHLVGTANIKAAAGTLDPTTSELITVIPGTMAQFELILNDCQSTGVAFTGTNTLSAQDEYTNIIKDFNALGNPVTITSNPNTGSITGLGSGLTNVLNKSDDFTNGVADLSGMLEFTGTSGNYTFYAASAGPVFTGTSGNVVINETPTGTSPQSFCGSATVNDLVATGTGIQWYNVSSGGTALSGTAALTDGATYYASQTVTSCESAERLAVLVNINSITVEAGPDITICETGGGAQMAGSVTGEVTTGEWSTNGNGTFDVTSSMTAYYTPSQDDIDAGSVTLTLTSTGSTICTSQSDQMTLTIQKSSTVAGWVKYSKSISPLPLNFVDVTLKQGSTSFQSATTDANGAYTLNNVCPGTYDVVFTCNKPILGAVNATDAAQINAWGNLLTSNPIDKVRFYAGDVAGDALGQINNRLTSTDAARVMMYFVYSGNLPPGLQPYSARGDWTFWHAGQTISVNPSSSSTTISLPTLILSPGTTLISDFNFYGLAMGDFNRSFVPTNLVKSASDHMILSHWGKQVIQPDKSIEVPVKVTQDVEVTAISLVLNIPSGQFEVEDVLPGKGQDHNMSYQVIGNELRIGWYSLTPVRYKANEDLVILKLKSHGYLADNEIKNFELAFTQENELADAGFQPIEQAEIYMPALINPTETYVDQDLALNCRPNPFNDQTVLSYTLPEEGLVTLDIYSMMGTKVTNLTTERQTNGIHTVTIDGKLLSPGVYTVRLLFKTASAQISKTLRLVRD